MTLAYQMIDDLIAEMFGQPDPALGGFVLDHGNLQAFAARIMVARIMVASRGCGKENAETSYGYREYCPEWVKNQKTSLGARHSRGY